MIKLLLLIFLDLAFPLVIIYMCKRWSVLKKLGSIVLAYGFGLVLGSTGLIPRGGDAYQMALQGRASLPESEMQALMNSGTITSDDADANAIASTQDMLISVIVPLAFPLLLFSLNIKRWLRFAREGFISMVLALISVVLIVAFSFSGILFLMPGRLEGCLSVYIPAERRTLLLSSLLSVSIPTFLL
jgi:hypothetical protein